MKTMSRRVGASTEETSLHAEWARLAEELEGKSKKPERAPRRPGRVKRVGVAALAALGVVGGAVGLAFKASDVVKDAKEPGIFASPSSGVRPRLPKEMPSMDYGERVGVFNTTATTAAPETALTPNPVLDIVDREGNVIEILNPLSELAPAQRLENSLNASLAWATTESPDLEKLVSPAARQWAADMVSAYGQGPDQPQLHFTATGPDGVMAEVGILPSENAGENLSITGGLLYLMSGNEVEKVFGPGSTITVTPRAVTDQLSVSHLVPSNPEG
jgi:hypothetical protein